VRKGRHIFGQHNDIVFSFITLISIFYLSAYKYNGCSDCLTAKSFKYNNGYQISLL